VTINTHFDLLAWPGLQMSEHENLLLV